jgi:hypothetical protein
MVLLPIEYSIDPTNGAYGEEGDLVLTAEEETMLRDAYAENEICPCLELATTRLMSKSGISLIVKACVGDAGDVEEVFSPYNIEDGYDFDDSDYAWLFANSRDNGKLGSFSRSHKETRPRKPDSGDFRGKLFAVGHSRPSNRGLVAFSHANTCW